MRFLGIAAAVAGVAAVAVIAAAFGHHLTFIGLIVLIVFWAVPVIVGYRARINDGRIGPFVLALVLGWIGLGVAAATGPRRQLR